jgi:hypothetical protein
MASAFTIEGAGGFFGRARSKKSRKSSGGKMQPGQCKRVRAGRSGHTIETCRLKNRNGKPVLKFTKGSYR